MIITKLDIDIYTIIYHLLCIEGNPFIIRFKTKDIDMDVKFGLHYPNVPDDESLQYNKLDVFDIKVDPYAGLSDEQKYQEFIKQNALENGQMLGFRTLEDDTYKRGNDAVEFERKAQEIYNTLENGKGKKVIIFKYKAKKDYRKKQGHRQPFTTIQITGIGKDGSSTKAEVRTSRLAT